MQRLAGIFLIVGSSLFLIGAFSDVAELFYTEPDVQKRLAIVEADPSGWAMMSAQFVAGAAVAGGGLVLLAWHLQRGRGAGIRLASAVAAGAALIGALLAVMGYSEHAVRPPQEWVPELVSIPLAGYAYIVLTQIALILTAVVLLRTGYPPWFGWTVLILTALTVIVLLLVRAFPPLLFYFITLFMGIVLAAMPAGDRTAAPTAAAGAPRWPPRTD